jgi:hypothetical protein
MPARASGGDYPDIALDGAGGLFVVSQGTPASLFAYSAAGFGAVSYDFDDGGASPQIAGSSSLPFLAWKGGSAYGELQATTFSGTTFGTIDDLGPVYTYAYDLELLYAATSGTAIAFYSNDQDQVFANFFDGVSWQPQLAVATAPNAGIARLARGAIDAQGRAVLVWQQQDGLNGFNDRDAAAALFDGASWQTSQVVGESGTDSAGFVDVAVNGAGQGFAVWGGSHLGVRPLDLGSGWGEAANIDPDETWLEDMVAIAVNEAGQAVLAWEEQKLYDFVPHLIAAIYDPEAGWSAPQELQASSYLTGQPSVAIDAGGRAVVAWTSSPGLVAAHYTASVGWGKSVSVYSGIANSNGGPSTPRIAIDGDTVFLVWGDRNGSGEASLFAARASLPP